MSIISWLITGGCGFIGTSLIKKLVSEGGHIIRILDNLSVGTREGLARVCQFMEVQNNAIADNYQNVDSEGSALVELMTGDIRDFQPCLNCVKVFFIISRLFSG
jgi:UDP-glucose 4-epimerase